MSKSSLNAAGTVLCTGNKAIERGGAIFVDHQSSVVSHWERIVQNTLIGQVESGCPLFFGQKLNNRSGVSKVRILRSGVA